MTPVLCLMNMVDIMELEDDDEYEGIVIVSVTPSSSSIVTVIHSY